MLERLLTSKARAKLLAHFLLNPGREFYVREVVRATGFNMNAVRRELKNLEGIELLKSSVRGNMKFYSVDESMPIFQELSSIVLKTEGVAKEIQGHLDDLGSIQCAFIYGSFARNDAGFKSDIDLFIIGMVDEDRLLESIRNIEEELAREVNYVIFSKEEFDERVKQGNTFITNVLKEPKLMILGRLP